VTVKANDRSPGGSLLLESIVRSLTAPAASSTSRIPFRLCLFNVLISAHRHLTPPTRPLFAAAIVPPLLPLAHGRDKDPPQLQTGALQALFTTVYGSKEAVTPYAAPLLHCALYVVKRSQAPEDARLAAARLLIALLGGEDTVLEACRADLLEVEVALRAVANMDASSAMRALSEQVLQCFAPQTAPSS
jgi:hypothetical protein